MAKIINLFAGPSVGKTTVASGLFYKLKTENYKVEIVNEFAKDLVYENRSNILLSDQLYVLANQNRNLMIKAFQESLDYIVMESPILLSNIYLNELSIYDEKLFKNFTLDLFNKYDNVNYFLERNSKFDYENTGRIHNEIESRMVDSQILSHLRNNGIEFNKFKMNENTVNNIKEHLEQI